MLMALLRGKLSRDQKNKEDLTTAEALLEQRNTVPRHICWLA
jgi:hypothetical protein